MKVITKVITYIIALTLTLAVITLAEQGKQSRDNIKTLEAELSALEIKIQDMDLKLADIDGIKQQVGSYGERVDSMVWNYKSLDELLTELGDVAQRRWERMHK